MKKIISLLLATCMIFALASCGSKSGNNNNSSKKNLKLGMYIVTSQSGSNASADGNGNAQTDSTVAAVLLDESGVIVDCIIDVAQTKIAFTATGEVLDKDKELKSKRELGDAYNMKGRSEIGKEWYEQAEGFCKYVIGKTAKEVSGIALDESGVATDEAITATTTIKIGDFIEAVSGACEAATELGAKEGDKLGLKVVTNIADSTDASADGDGTCYAYSTYCAVTVDKDAKVTSSVVDATQSKININTSGEITSDLENSEVLSKNVLKEDYGMKGRSEIGKEWYEQAAGFCEYIKGKSADEIKGIALDESGKAKDDALLATTTITIGNFIDAASGAIADAK